MQVILPGFLTFDDYSNYVALILSGRVEVKDVDRKCPTCGILDALHIHGSYNRNPDRPIVLGKKLLNPIIVLRYICKYADCRKTCSQLPECISPRRWYLWKEQQRVVQNYLDGNNWHEISTTTCIPVGTCKRWCSWLKDKFNIHAQILKNVAGNLHQVLADCFDFKSFWQKCFTHISLDRAMLLCHQSGLVIP